MLRGGLKMLKKEKNSISKLIDPAMAQSALEEEKEAISKEKEAISLEKEALSKEKTKEEHAPSEEHPRFKEIYGKMKTFERGMEDKDKQINDLKTHNMSLDKALNNIDLKVSETTRPDPADNPEEYEKWLMDKVMKSLITETKTPLSTMEVSKEKTPVVDQRILMQEYAMAAMHDDYYDVLKIVGDEMKTNEFLREEIITHTNPPKKMYEYHTRLMQQKEKNVDSSRMESGGYDTKSNKLSEDQKSMAANLGLSEQSYKKQLDFMNKKK